jgi:hypothetical protein
MCLRGPAGALRSCDAALPSACCRRPLNNRPGRRNRDCLIDLVVRPGIFGRANPHRQPRACLLGRWLAHPITSNPHDDFCPRVSICPPSTRPPLLTTAWHRTSRGRFAAVFATRAITADGSKRKVTVRLRAVRGRDVFRPDGCMLYGLREWVVAPSASSPVVARALSRPRGDDRQLH